MYRTLFLSNKLISYVAFYVGHIQTGFLMTFRKSYGGTGIVIPVKKRHRSGKNRNLEDSCRNRQPSLATPTWTFPSNFGTSLHLRCKTPLTSFDAPKSTQPNRLTKYLRDRTTGIDTPWHLLVPRQSFMKMPTKGHHGHLMV